MKCSARRSRVGEADTVQCMVASVKRYKSGERQRTRYGAMDVGEASTARIKRKRWVGVVKVRRVLRRSAGGCSGTVVIIRRSGSGVLGVSGGARGCFFLEGFWAKLRRSLVYRGRQ